MQSKPCVADCEFATVNDSNNYANSDIIDSKFQLIQNMIAWLTNVNFFLRLSNFTIFAFNKQNGVHISAAQSMHIING